MLILFILLIIICASWSEHGRERNRLLNEIRRNTLSPVARAKEDAARTRQAREEMYLGIALVVGLALFVLIVLSFH